MKKPYQINIVTLFPEMFPGALSFSVTGRALKEGLWQLSTTNIRDFGIGKYKSVDDTPYGGGAGMVMRADVVSEAIRSAKKANAGAKVVYLSPCGQKFTQEKSRKLASLDDGIILLCGHYEGIDERVIEKEVDEEISIGDYVLSGGEVAAFVVADSILRNIPGVLGGEGTLKEESFDIEAEGKKLLEYPHYTRPEVWEGAEVPEVLKSGHHAKIDKWRKDKSVERTEKRRLDLLK